MENLLAYLSGIRDNHTRGPVAQFLKDKIGPGSVLPIVSAYFTIYAYEALAAELEGIQGPALLRSLRTYCIIGQFFQPS
jgi:hypothetical protein